MEWIVRLIDQFISVSSYITLPFLIFVISLLIHMSPRRALMSAIRISISLIGISILFGYFNSIATPVVSRILLSAGKATPVVDTGWPVLSLFIWSNKISYVIIPLSLGVNLLLLKLRKTSTFNIDIWNLWHLAVPSVLIYAASRSLVTVLILDLFLIVLNLKLADWAQPFMADFYKGREKIANSHINSLTWLPVAIVGNRVLDWVGRMTRRGVRQRRRQGGSADALARRQRLGQMVTPLSTSLTAGVGIGLASGLGLLATIEFALKITAVFMILPKVVLFMQEGFQGIAEAMERYARRGAVGDRPIFIGVSHLVYTDDASIIISSVILMPLTIFAALALDFISILPLADLSNIMSLIVVINAVTNGHVIKNLVISMPVIVVSLFSASRVAPLFTAIARQSGFDAGVGDRLWNSSLNGNNIFLIMFAEMDRGNRLAYIGIPVLALFVFVSWLSFRKRQWAGGGTVAAEKSGEPARTSDNLA